MKKEEFEKLSKDEQDKLLHKYEEVQKLMEEIKAKEASIPQPTMKEFEEKVKGVMEEYMAKMTPTDKKFFVFPGIGNNADLLNNLTPEGKFVKTMKFFKAMIGADVTTLNAMHEEVRIKANLSEGTTTAGGFLVPEEFYSEIVRLRPLYGVIRRDARIIPMRYDTLNIPGAGAQDVTASFVNEASTIASTDPTFRSLILTINKLATIPKVSSELLADANVDVLSYLSMIIAEAFAATEDDQGFNGTGSPFVGLLQATGVPTSPVAGGTRIDILSYPDIVKATHNIYDNATIGAKFYFHRSVLGHLRSRITTTGAPILLPNQSELAGYPFVSAEKLPGTGHASAVAGTFPFAVFGNLQRALAVGERGSMTMTLGREGTVGSDNLFEKDMVALRVIERIAMGVLEPSAFTRLTT